MRNGLIVVYKCFRKGLRRERSLTNVGLYINNSPYIMDNIREMEIRMDFLERTISKSNKDFTVTRSRNSNGFAAIKIEDALKNSIYICNRQEAYGDMYEQVALGLVKLLDEIAKNYCTLPKSTCDCGKNDTG